jgi:3-oxoadipate enol-lactonase
MAVDSQPPFGRTADERGDSVTKRVAIGDVTFAVADHGAGPPLLLVHGFPLDHTMWCGQWEMLSADFRVLAPDLRGFGGSGGAADVVTMERFADDLALLLDALDIREPVALGGLSMGGYIAWEFWRRHRARLRALILCDTRAAADPPEARQNRWRTAERALAEGVGFLADTMLARLFAPATCQRQPQLIEATRQVLLAATPQAVAAASRGMAERPDSRVLLETIDIPTLVLCGVEDAISPVAEMRGMASRIRGARFVEIPDAGHMSPLENPRAVNAAFRDFLRPAV